MSDVIPEFWTKPTAAAPECARPVGWLPALPVLVASPIVPKRLGARVGQARWAPTLLVHGCCLLLGLLFGAYAGSLVYQSGWLGATAGVPEVGLDALQGFVAGAVNVLYIVTDGHGDIYAVIGGLAAVHAGAWLVGLLLMPFVAAGERFRLLYWRCVKLVLWSTVCLLPLALAMLVMVCVGVWHEEWFDKVEWETAIGGVNALWLLWWLSVLPRLGAHYAGPPDGPGWQPRRPRCNRCGYVLTGLSLEGRCPECGLAVRASLPEARGPSRWAAAARIWEKPRAYLRTAWQVLRGGEFFRTLAVYRGTSTAVSFAMWTGLLMGILCPLAVVSAADPHEASYLEELTNGALRFAIATAAAVVVFAGGLALVALRACRLGWRDPRPSTVAVCYGAALFWPMVVTLWVSAIALLLAVDAGLLRGGFAIPMFGWVDYGMLWGLGLSLPVVAAFTWALVRLRRALRDVRFAGA